MALDPNDSPPKTAVDPLAVSFQIDAPITLKARPSGEIEVTCYQVLSDSTTALPWTLVFSRQAAGQLVATLRHAVDRGLIVLEPTSGNELQ